MKREGTWAREAISVWQFFAQQAFLQPRAPGEQADKHERKHESEQ